MNEDANRLACPICLEFQAKSDARVSFFIAWVSSDWASFTLDAIQRIAKCGHPLRVVDVTQFSYPRVPIQFNEIPFIRRAIEGSVEFLHLENTRQIKLGLKPQLELWAQDSISSELSTKYKGRLPRHLKPMLELEKLAASQLLTGLILELKKIEVNKENEVWLYPNGRYATQRAISETAKELGIASMCYEKSRFYSRYYLRSYRVHDRVSLQADFQSQSHSVSADSELKVRTWIRDRRTPTSSTNPFSAAFRETCAPEFNALPGTKTAIFFSSSRDELEGLGPNWTTFEWIDQYDAFLTIGKTLRNLGWDLVLRLHPNLSNKTWPDVKAEFMRVESLRSAGFKVIGPNSNLNSYSLAESADLVVVARSTLGIESMAMGKNVFVTANAFYDQLSACKLIRSEADLAHMNGLLNYNAEGSKEAISWLAFNFDRDFAYEKIDLRLQLKLAKRLRGLANLDVFIYYFTLLLFKVYSTLTISKKIRLIDKYSSNLTVS